ncbi:MAG: electron-transfer flavoprotein:ubiquinone oxidoreductase [Sedimentisphaeraceae bacterium JB056]
MSMADQKKTDLLIVGAGPAGLSCAITAKKEYPKLKVCVVDKSPFAGGHNLSGASLACKPIENLLNMTVKDWQKTPIVKDALGDKFTADHIYMISDKSGINLTSTLRVAKKTHFLSADPFSSGNYAVSITKLTRLLACIAKNLGVELLWNLAVEDMEYNGCGVVGIRAVDHSDKNKKDSLERPDCGMIINADFIVLSEGCDGFVTEKFISRNGLVRKQEPIFSIGVKQVVNVSSNQYKAFGVSSFMKLMGYPFWRPLRGPSILGYSAIYPAGTNRLAVVAVTSLDWKYADLSPRNILELIKEHPIVSKFTVGGEVVENGLKMMPQGGYNSIPFEPDKLSIGKENVVIIGDSASLFSVRRQKGIGNAIISGMSAGVAIGNINNKHQFADQYTKILQSNGLLSDIRKTSHYRQLASRAGVGAGVVMGSLVSVLPFKPARSDRKAMTGLKYNYEPSSVMPDELFIKKAGIVKNDSEGHVFIKDLDICKWDCMRTYDCPCLKFCPSGAFEKVLEHIQPKSSPDCFHCKTCYRKCPYENIGWTMPPAGTGPRYHFL